MAPVIALPGDFYLTKPLPSTPWPWRILGMLIGKGSREPGEAPTDTTHEGGISKGGPLCEAIASEAAAPRWRTAPLIECCQGKAVSIWRLVPLTPQQREDLGAGYASHEGERYNYLRILAHGLDDALGWIAGRPVRLFRRFPHLPQNICSTGINREIARVTGDPRPFGVPWVEAQPDDTLDWCVAAIGGHVVQVWPTDGRLFGSVEEMRG